MAKEKENVKEKEREIKDFQISKIELLIDTPYIAPLLSPVKMMKKAQIARLLECYKKQGATDDDLETLSHIDRAFERDSECNAFIPGSVLSGAVRQALNNRNATIKGMIIIPKDAIIVSAKNEDIGGERKPMFYEYIPAGTKLGGTISINVTIPPNLRVRFGAYQQKGYGSAIVNVTPVA